MARDPSSNSTEGTGAFSEKVVQPLGKEPAFLLIFAICVIFSGGISTYGIVSQSAQALYVGLAAFALALCAAVGVVSIITRAREREGLKSEIGVGREIRVEHLTTSAATAQSTDPATHYIDSAHGFLFSRPKSDAWGQPESISGMSKIVPARMEVSPEILHEILRQMSQLPFGKMLIEQSLIRLRTGHVLKVEFTGESTTDPVEAVIEQLRPALIEQNPGASSENIEAELVKTRISLVRGDGDVRSMQFSNEFCVTWLDKSLLPVNFTPTLARIFLQIAMPFVAMAVDLRRHEKSITLTMRSDLRKVLVNGQKTDLSIERWLLLTERKDYFYMVEIAFSPQTQDSLAVWEDLRAMIDSFRLIA